MDTVEGTCQYAYVSIVTKTCRLIKVEAQILGKGQAQQSWNKVQESISGWVGGWPSESTVQQKQNKIIFRIPLCDFVFILNLLHFKQDIFSLWNPVSFLFSNKCLNHHPKLLTYSWYLGGQWTHISKAQK